MLITLKAIGCFKLITLTLTGLTWKCIKLAFILKGSFLGPWTSRTETIFNWKKKTMTRLWSHRVQTVTLHLKSSSKIAGEYHIRRWFEASECREWDTCFYWPAAIWARSPSYQCVCIQIQRRKASISSAVVTPERPAGKGRKHLNYVLSG